MEVMPFPINDSDNGQLMEVIPFSLNDSDSFIEEHPCILHSLLLDGNVSALLGDLSNVELTALTADSQLRCMEMEAEYGLSAGEIVGLLIPYGIIFLLGTLGNLLVISSILRYRGLQTVTNYFLLSLGFADLLLICLCIPVKVAGHFSFSWEFGEPLCKLVHYVQSISMVISVNTLTVISLERYYAVMEPLRARYLCTKRHAQIMIGLIWTTSCLLCIPDLVGYELFIPATQDHRDPADRTGTCQQWLNQPVAYLANHVYMFVLLLGIPLPILIFSYTTVCVHLWRASTWKMRNSSSSARYHLGSSNGSNAGNVQLTSSVPICYTAEPGDAPVSLQTSVKSNKSNGSDSQSNKKDPKEDFSARKQIIQMLLAVVILFVINWTPILTLNLLDAANVFDRWNPMKYPFYRRTRQAFLLLAYANSAVNPLIYAFVSKYFRRKFVQTMQCECFCIRKRKGPYRATYNGVPRNGIHKGDPDRPSDPQSPASLLSHDCTQISTTAHSP